MTTAAALLSACGGGGDDAPIEVPLATAGTISVAAMTDAPSCGFDEVNISIARIRFHQDFQATAAASGWTELTFSLARKVNLLNAQGVLSGATMDSGDLALFYAPPA